MDKKSLFIPLTVKMEDETSKRGTFSGYGSVFGNIDLGGDIVEKGAFAASLSEWNKNGQLPQMLWYHDSAEIIGEWTKMEEDEKGLYVEGKLWVNGESRLERAVQAYNVIKSNSVKGLSIGYQLKDYENEELSDGRIITRIIRAKLFEVSIAPWAMNPQAAVSQVKKLTDGDGRILSKREVEKALRDATDLSRAQVKALLADGYKGIYRDDEDSVDVENRDDSLDLSGLNASIQKLFQLKQR